MSPRYVIGIDLGTTHTALAYAEISPVDAGGDGARAEIAPIPQLVAAGTVEARSLLPSFLYLAHESEGPQALPWDPARRFVVGEHARARGADAPARLVSSAKSWLSHAGVDRRAATLPVGAPEDVEKISPVEASWRYLEHLGEAWDDRFAGEDPSLAFASQEIVLTVPASFDASARDLTVEAAAAAGIEDITLLEEPQAALYAWIEGHGAAWRKEIRVGDVLLVVDVGGGTTDFSAIAALEKDGSLELTRIAVGDHILLGGDNMDLALAHRPATEARRRGQGDRPLADERPHPRLPHRQGAPPRRRRARVRAHRRRRPRLQAPRRRPAVGAHPRRGRAHPRRRLLPRGRLLGPPRRPRSRRPHPDRPPLRLGRRRHQAPRRLPRPPGRRHGQARRLRPRRPASETAPPASSTPPPSSSTAA